MSVDLCFWGSGTGTPEELYDDAADGEFGRFDSSDDVLAFRRDLLQRWPDLDDSLEPPEYDPDAESPVDLSLYVLITLNARLGDRIPSILELAEAHRLSGYDPQTQRAIGTPLR